MQLRMLILFVGSTSLDLMEKAALCLEVFSEFSCGLCHVLFFTFWVDALCLNGVVVLVCGMLVLLFGISLYGVDLLLLLLCMAGCARWVCSRSLNALVN